MGESSNTFTSIQPELKDTYSGKKPEQKVRFEALKKKLKKKKQ